MLGNDENDPRQRILTSTLALVAAGGPEAASLRRIGAAAGLHNSSLFHYFPSKRAIHDALAEQIVGRARAHLAPLLAGGQPQIEALFDAFGDLAEHLAAHPLEASYLTQALASSGGSWAPAHERVLAELLKPVWEWLVRARDAGEIRRVRPQPATLQLVGLVLLEPAFAGRREGAGLRPASHARRREIEAWVRGALARR